MALQAEGQEMGEPPAAQYAAGSRDFVLRQVRGPNRKDYALLEMKGRCVLFIVTTNQTMLYHLLEDEFQLFAAFWKIFQRAKVIPLFERHHSLAQ